MDPSRTTLILLALAALSWIAVAACAHPIRRSASERDASPKITTVALRVHHLDAMVAFYTEAFGASFREVDTFGIKSRFGDVGGITLKLVPIRESSDFVDFPTHQIGVEVEDVASVIALAEKHGGRQEGDTVTIEGRVSAAVRDPDGNTIELYQRS